MRHAAAAPLGRPIGASGEETRRRILDAAIRCVAEGGYSQATIREIARAADVTSGSLYNYFATKNDLLRATAQSIEELTLPRLRAAAQSSGDIVDRLDALLDESDRLMREFPYLAAFERAMRAEHTAHRRRGDTQAGVHVIRALIAEIVDDARRDGSLAVEADPESVVDVLFALARGLTERAGESPLARRDTLATAKRLIRGTLFSGPDDTGRQVT
ncbi:transcriptional regulator [Mycolicibacterium chubuense NBB4]|uniref:Transcriptional regulator n=1 Tax=Mycolicibacterium chubuense (strain NBB4) TaxID=710421 RepID=I4BJ00_MYCCN|nr:TetR/AcrR family transcriptional regulator [Mycolicibacterium chubuense]AFM17257.1 transcriptional regulator [Mycolicibacterium chubuense NBB4]